MTRIATFTEFLPAVYKRMALPSYRVAAIVLGGEDWRRNFLQQCEEEFSRIFLTVKFPATVGDIGELTRAVMQEADAAMARHGAEDLLSALVAGCPEELASVRQTDLRRALRALQQAESRHEYNVQRARLRRWLHGHHLEVLERRELGVSMPSPSSSLAVWLVGELLSLARRCGLVQGLVLLLPGMEGLFAPEVPAPRRRAFLQGLTHFFAGLELPTLLAIFIRTDCLELLNPWLQHGPLSKALRLREES